MRWGTSKGVGAALFSIGEDIARVSREAEERKFREALAAQAEKARIEMEERAAARKREDEERALAMRRDEERRSLRAFGVDVDKLERIESGRPNRVRGDHAPGDAPSVEPGSIDTSEPERLTEHEAGIVAAVRANKDPLAGMRPHERAKQLLEERRVAAAEKLAEAREGELSARADRHREPRQPSPGQTTQAERQWREAVRAASRQADAAVSEVARLERALNDASKPVIGELRSHAAQRKENVARLESELARARSRADELRAAANDLADMTPEEWREHVARRRSQQAERPEPKQAERPGSSKDNPIRVNSPDELKNIAPGTWISIIDKGQVRVLQYRPK